MEESRVEEYQGDHLIYWNNPPEKNDKGLNYSNASGDQVERQKSSKTDRDLTKWIWNIKEKELS